MDQDAIKKTTDRKQDHIDLAFQSDMANQGPDPRFYYEPMLSGHPQETDLSIEFLGKKLGAPIWVSSMTGGTEMSLDINRRLATTCARFKLGMGLGSCRPLLENYDRIRDFDVRGIIGNDLPLFANLGIAQIEEAIKHKGLDTIQELIVRLKADGLIVHINPLQEWLQPEGDVLANKPIETIHELLSEVNYPVIVKEVGQGMGPKSISGLLRLPLAAFELAAHGGTNFSKLELLRSDPEKRETYASVSRLGHDIQDMCSWINEVVSAENEAIRCRQVIISGGLKSFLDGYYWMQKLKLPSIYGQASKFLQYARDGQEELDRFVSGQIQGLRLAQAYLKVKE